MVMASDGDRYRVRRNKVPVRQTRDCAPQTLFRSIHCRRRDVRDVIDSSDTEISLGLWNALWVCGQIGLVNSFPAAQTAKLESLAPTLCAKIEALMLSMASR